MTSRELNKSPDSTLFLSESWIEQIPTAGYLTNHNHLKIKLNTASYRNFKPLVKELDKLRNKIGNRKLIIFGDIPGTGPLHDVSSCITRPFFINKNCTDKFVLPESYNKKSRYINQFLAEYIKKHKNTYFLNPYNVFCKNNKCYSLSKDGYPYYADQRHLSVFGSKYYIKHIQKKLLKIINTKSL